jgi:hypothetical protein
VRIEGRERVGLSVAETWRRLNDPAWIQRCTPGLERLEETRRDHYEAALDLKVPAIRGRFTGSVDFVERLEPARLRMRVEGKGSPGFVSGEAELRLEASEGSTLVHYAADVEVGGQVGRLGQRMISGVAKDMAGQFFAELGRATDSRVSAPSPWRAFLALLWRTLRRLLGLRRGD